MLLLALNGSNPKIGFFLVEKPSNSKTGIKLPFLIFRGFAEFYRA